jgi:hypothetical protein
MDGDAKIKKQPASAAPPPRTPAAAEAAAKKTPTTLLDAYEIECIRRELERLVLKHNRQSAADGGGDETAAAPLNAGGHRFRHDEHLQLPHQRVRSSTKKAMSAKRVSPSPSPSLPPRPPPTACAGPKKGRGGVRLLGRHAVAICSGTAPVAAAPAGGGRGRRAVAICSGTAAPAVARSTVGVCGGRRPHGGFREVEMV